MNDANPRAAHSHTRQSVGGGWLILLLVLVAALVMLQVLEKKQRPLHNPDSAPREVTPRGNLHAEELSTIELFRNASPSVVHVRNIAVRKDALSFNVFEIQQGVGTGFVWDQGGNVVTNYHVIQSAQAVRITLADNSTWDARLVGFDRPKDIAVLQIDAPAERLKPINIGRSDNLQVGQKVFAIGNPFELDQTLTTGVISGLGRELPVETGKPIQGVIQTDAAINPGNSGGPLLDSSGNVIGINTAIVDPSSGSAGGIGFAVPVDIANRVVPSLIKDGRVLQPGLGIIPFDNAVVERLRLEGVIEHAGVLVRDVMPDSAAKSAGIVPTRRDNTGTIILGDLIVAIDDKPIANLTELFKTLDGRDVGDEIQVSVIRFERKVNLKLTLQALPDE
ncbi:MAG: 2-alkenal reductase [Planctomycetaceae bacterium]|nr:2-alkenal reductase [Planctomycetaceae bacterium]